MVDLPSLMDWCIDVQPGKGAIGFCLNDPAECLSTFCGHFAAPELLNAKVYTGLGVDV